ncbi:MAG: aspartate kinase [Phycisphaerae bacterium]|nr:aspartate kinase [Phycisphaerae bacterium]
MKVAKFGGTSLAGAAQVRKVCEIVAADPERKLVVVSAPGKRHSKDIKVTDLLIALAEAFLERGSAEAELKAVVDRYAEIQRELGLKEDVAGQIEQDLRGRLKLDTSHRLLFMDALKAAGEDNCAKLAAGVLRGMGVEASYIDPRQAGLLLSDDFGNAAVLDESYDNLKPLGSIDGVGVFPGFFGYTRDGKVATFPRGGSDITGAILAAAVGADVYENFTDVDAVFAADPRIIEDPAAIEEMTYREMRELSYAGFSVLHDEAILPAVRAGIPICIKNTDRPEAPGTRIVRDRKLRHGQVTGIASGEGFCTVYVTKYLMNREVGFGRRLLQIFEEEDLSYEHIPSGVDNVSVILRDEEIPPDVEHRVTKRIQKELGAEDVTVEHGLSLVMLVGEGMRYTVGLAGRAMTALADAGVNIEMLNQGSSEISLMLGLRTMDRIRAVRALYEAFFKSA